MDYHYHLLEVRSTKIQMDDTKCKAEIMSSSTPYRTLAKINDESIQDAIKGLAMGEEAVLGEWDFIEIKGIGERQAKRYCNGDQTILGDVVLFAKLTKLCAMRGDLQLLMMMLPEGMMITRVDNLGATNGSVDDEIASEVVDLAKAKKAFDAGDKRNALMAIGEAKTDLARLEKEVIAQ